MKKQKLECIEAYIYAKTLNLICINTNTINETKNVQNAVNSAYCLSCKLLKTAEQKIKDLKLNDASFLLLKKQLEDPAIYQNNLVINYCKICEMVKDFGHFKKLLVS